MNTTCDDLFSTINLRYFYGEPYTGIHNEPHTGIQNEPFIGIQNEPYTGIQNEPYTGIQNERGVRVQCPCSCQHANHVKPGEFAPKFNLIKLTKNLWLSGKLRACHSGGAGSII